MEEKTQTKKFPARIVFFIVLFLIILGAVWYAYYWYSTTVTKVMQADQVIMDAKNYETLTNEIQTELARCQAFIAQEQGAFGEFEYCKRFINWANSATEALTVNP